MYIGEAAPPRFRGALVSFNQLAITSGILVSYLADYGLASSRDWRLMFGLATIPAVLLFAGMLTQAESPAWLVTHDREDDARRVLSRLRHAGDVDDELESMKKGRQPAGRPAASCSAPGCGGRSPWACCWPCSSRSPGSTPSSTTPRRC